MKLICELNEHVQCITEEKDGKKTLFIEGIFMQAGIKNKNGRVYPSNVMETEVGRYLKETVQQHRAYGELGHPEGPQINLHRVSHLIESLRMDGNNVIGRAKIVDTEMGNIAKGLLEGGANLGVSSRGLGSLKPNGDLMEVQSDFKIVTAADIVADPSAPDAFVRGIMENVDWVYQNGTWKVADQMKTEIKRMSKRELEESKLRLFKFFLKQL
jgi:Prohead core protein serine protease